MRHNLLRREHVAGRHRAPSARIRRRWRSATAGSATTCRTSSAGRSRAMPKARGWRASMPALAASPARARRASSACTSSRRRSRTTPTTAPASRSSRIPSAIRGPSASGHDCTSLVVSVANRPGAVHDMLVPLKTHGVSMTRFESRPARSGQWEYYFYIDLARPSGRAARRRRAAGTARRLRLLQGARHLPDRRALSRRCPH